MGTVSRMNWDDVKNNNDVMWSRHCSFGFRADDLAQSDWNWCRANKQTSMQSKQHGTTHTKQQCVIDPLPPLSSRFWLCWFFWLTRVQISIHQCRAVANESIQTQEIIARNMKGNDCLFAMIGAISNFKRLRSIVCMDSRASRLFPIQFFWTQQMNPSLFFPQQ
mgnify:CR=1 FL=1